MTELCWEALPVLRSGLMPPILEVLLLALALAMLPTPPALGLLPPPPPLLLLLHWLQVYKAVGTLCWYCAVTTLLLAFGGSCNVAL